MIRPLTIAGLLILTGALASGLFRLESSSGFGPDIMALSFSRSSPLNTRTEYRINEHGTIIGIRREIYDRRIRWAVVTLIVQGLCLIPAMVILIRLSVKKTRLHWQELVLILLGVVIWLASEGSSFG